MLKPRKLVLAAGGSSMRLCIALVFVVAAGLSALVHAGEMRTVEGFEIDRVILRGNDELKITWADENRLFVKGDEGDLEQQPFYVSGRTLYLGATKRGRKVNDIKYLLEVQSLEHIELEGSGAIWVDAVDTGEISYALKGSGDMNVFSVNATGEVELSVAGSGSMQVAEIRADHIEVDVSGSGELTLGAVKADSMKVSLSGSGELIGSGEGEVAMLDVSLAGSGDIELPELRVQNSDVSIIGSGDVIIHVEKELDVSIIGSGDLNYTGDADVDTSILGSGSVSRND